MEIDEDMSCQQVREVIAGTKDVAKGEQLSFVRHIRTCNECRREIPAEDRANAIHAVITANE
jgi:hypothetical protein